MDMLYARYSCPMDLVRTYINQRRFGDFVTHFMKGEQERRKEKAEKEDDLYLWIAFVHRDKDAPEITFNEWKSLVLGGVDPENKTGSEPAKKTGGADADLDDAGIQAIISKTFRG